MGALKPGGKYYFNRNGSTLVAFTVGSKFQPGNSFKAVGAHTDSPVLKGNRVAWLSLSRSRSLSIPPPSFPLPSPPRSPPSNISPPPTHACVSAAPVSVLPLSPPPAATRARTHTHAPPPAPPSGFRPVSVVLILVPTFNCSQARVEEDGPRV